MLIEFKLLAPRGHTRQSISWNGHKNFAEGKVQKSKEYRECVHEEFIKILKLHPKL